jgi:hypothetical protein
MTFREELRTDLRYVRRFWRRYLLIELPVLCIPSAFIAYILVHLF